MEEIRILIVDDDQTTLSILHNMLKPYPFILESAPNGLDGLAAYQNNKPDIILSDINMPHLDGLDMIEQIRVSDETVKVMLFTNFENRDRLLRAIELGVNQFLSKPFDNKTFIREVTRLSQDVMDKRRNEKVLRRQQNILHAINQMTHGFLKQNSWMKALSTQMHVLKEAADVSTIFLYENSHNPDNLTASQLLYLNDDEEAVGKESIHYKNDALMRWKNELEKNCYVNGSISDYDKSKQKLLELFNINSLLILPIFVQEKWWGFLGIGDAQNEVLDETNVEMLSTAATIIGSAINNYKNTKSLQISYTIFKHTLDGVVITNKNNEIIHTNNACLEITGYNKENILGKNPKILKSGTHDKQFYQKMWHILHTKGYWQGEITNRKRNGQSYIQWLSITTVKDSDDEIENYIAIFSDVTHHRKDTQAKLHHATHDPLTGLSNRLLLNDRLHHAIDHAKRFEKHIGLIFCDLDNFKPINDTYGHTIGDEILKRVSHSLRSILRSEDTICRFGGDEFVILVEDLKDFDFMHDILTRINQLTTTPCVIDNHTIQMGMSIGAAIYPDDGLTSDQLIKAADTAMYRAKRGGKNRVKYAQEDINIYALKQKTDPNAFSYVI